VTSPLAVGVYVVLFILSAKNTYTKMKKTPWKKLENENQKIPIFASLCDSYTGWPGCKMVHFP